MGWEQRGTGRYYYHKQRIGGRVVSEYVGLGPTAELAADMNVLRGREQVLEREIRKKELEAIRAVDAEVDEVCSLVQTLTSGALLGAGYHMHKGQWRKGRDD